MSTRHLEETAPESTVAGRYLVRREIGRGASGAVFEAEHLVTRAKVALKTLRRPSLDHLGAHARLMREGRILGAIRHPFVVAVQDAGECPLHGPFLALEMIDGRPLSGILLARGSLPVGQAVALVVQLCDALSSVHARQVVHRDVKPSNILIRRLPTGSQVELVDFGIAKVAAEDDPLEGEKLTQVGEIVGTVDYMSPEQLMQTHVVDARTDVYAAAVVLYECLVGSVPFSGPWTAVMTSMMSGEMPTPVREVRPEVPVALASVLMGALSVPPERRPASAAAFASACVEAFGARVPSLDLLNVRDDRATDAVDGAEHSAAREAESRLRRRKFVRAPYMAPVRIVLDGGTHVDGRTEDISIGGILVVTTAECVGEQRVTVRLPLPTSGRVVVLNAKTKWMKTQRHKWAAGIEFEALPEEALAEIAHYVAAMSNTVIM